MQTRQIPIEHQERAIQSPPAGALHQLLQCRLSFRITTETIRPAPQFQALPYETGIVRAVLDNHDVEQINFYISHRDHPNTLSFSGPAGPPSPPEPSPSRGRVSQNREPPLGAGSIQIRPAVRSTILRHVAKPIPRPGYFEFSRWSGWKIRSACCGSMPIPLSSTRNSHRPSFPDALIETRGVCPSG